MDNNSKKPTFVVDLAQTMIISGGASESRGDKQKLYCSCGSTQEFSSKIMRNIVKNYDELTEDSESLKEVTCKDCNTEYNLNKKVYLLTPNKDELYSIEYFLEKTDKSLKLFKKKFFANHSSNKKTLTTKEVIDVLELDLTTNVVTLNIKPPFNTKDSLCSTNFNNLGLNFDEELNIVVDITNVSVLEEFLSFVNYIDYVGLDSAYLFLEIIQEKIKDLEKFKKINFLDFLFSNNKIYTEKNERDEEFYYQMIDSGFGDGNKVKKTLVYGDYIFNLLSTYKLFLSILSFEESSTIILTKNYEFFKKFIESKYICLPSTYKSKEASNANKIIETSIFFDKEGKTRLKDLNIIDENEKNNLKISDTLYNSIENIKNLDILVDCYSNNILNKSEMEYLFQNFENKRVYEILERITQQKNRDGQIFTIKHCEHILKSSFDIESNKSDYVSVYSDTIRVIGLLELKDKEIFKCKNYEALKNLHDDYTARFNAMKDSRKAEIYLKAINPYLHLNKRVGYVDFEVVASTERLNLEGLQMHHCIYTYLNRICEQDYLAINVTHSITKERATAGFVVSKAGKLELEQLKGFYNSRATSEVIQSVLQFCNENKIAISNYNNGDTTPDKSRQREMPGQMKEDDWFVLREKMETEKRKKEKTSNKEGDSEKKDNFLKKLFS
jgi:RNAse (barnase) inhibitor barstar